MLPSLADVNLTGDVDMNIPTHGHRDTTPPQDIVVHGDGTLVFDGHKYRCALGKGGVTNDKAEGDMATPIGSFAIRSVYYRKDKLGELHFPFRTHFITKHDAWCDDVNDVRYNTHIVIPKDTTHDEALWREDDVYDIVVVLGYNDDPPTPGKGSAIFMHVAREGYTPTAGCIALAREDLLKVLQEAHPSSQVVVQP